MKSSENVFDRKYSSFSTLQTGIVDWDAILKDVSWFHFSAIAPAVSESAAALVKEALQAASRKKITISVDLNYRSLLWKYRKQPVAVMPDLVQYCNVVMGNIWSANTLLGVPLDSALHNKWSQQDFVSHATQTAKYIFQKFPNCKWVAKTFRFDGIANDIKYYATLNTPNQQVVSPVFQTSSIVDKVGSGDCFMGGLIYGISSNHLPKEIIGFAAAAAFCKLQEKGDSTRNSGFSHEPGVIEYREGCLRSCHFHRCPREYSLSRPAGGSPGDTCSSAQRKSTNCCPS